MTSPGLWWTTAGRWVRMADVPAFRDSLWRPLPSHGHRSAGPPLRASLCSFIVVPPKAIVFCLL